MAQGKAMTISPAEQQQQQQQHQLRQTSNQGREAKKHQSDRRTPQSPKSTLAHCSFVHLWYQECIIYVYIYMYWQNMRGERWGKSSQWSSAAEEQQEKQMLPLRHHHHHHHQRDVDAPHLTDYYYYYTFPLRIYPLWMCMCVYMVVWGVGAHMGEKSASKERREEGSNGFGRTRDIKESSKVLTDFCCCATR